MTNKEGKSPSSKHNRTKAVEREYLPCLQQTKNYESVWTRLCFGCVFVFDFRGFTRVFSGNETATNSESEREMDSVKL